MITSLDFVISVSKVSVRMSAKIPERVCIWQTKKSFFYPNTCFWTQSRVSHNAWTFFDRYKTRQDSRIFYPIKIVQNRSSCWRTDDRHLFFLLISEMKTKKMTNNCARAKCIWSNYTHNPIIWTLFEFILFYGRTRGHFHDREYYLSTFYFNSISLSPCYLPVRGLRKAHQVVFITAVLWGFKISVLVFKYCKKQLF